MEEPELAGLKRMSPIVATMYLPSGVHSGDSMVLSLAS
jgi:hypothetical protein